MGNACHKSQLVALRRIEGQIRGVQRMVEEGQYCMDIVNQILAVKAALSRVEDKVLEKHLDHCVTDAAKSASEEDKQVKLDEIMAMIKRLRKNG